MKPKPPVIPALLLAAAVAATAALSSCALGEGILAFLNASSFPAHLGLTEKSVDLSHAFDWDRDGDCWDCDHVFHLRGASGGYVFLVLSNSRLVILDEELDGMQQYYHDWEYGSLGLYNSGGVAGYFVGGWRYDDNPPDFFEYTSALPAHGFGFSDGANAYALVHEEGDLVTYRDDIGQYDRAVLTGLDGTRRRFSGLAVTDAAGVSEVVLFFERDYEDRQIEAVFLDPAAVVAGLSVSPGPDDFTIFGSPVVEFPPAERGRYYAAGSGFAGLWNGSLRLVEVSDGKAEIVSSLSGYGTEKLALGFDAGGGRFYVFDPEVKMLYRCRTWW
jgi:hypothetical protein